MWFLALISTFNGDSSAIPREMERRRLAERDVIKNYKVEITEGFWLNSIKYIQRDKPLSEVEVNEILNERPS